MTCTTTRTPTHNGKVWQWRRARCRSVMQINDTDVRRTQMMRTWKTAFNQSSTETDQNVGK